MAQKNYFTYNIIDTIYFNQPTGDQLTELYGIESNFNRRNSIEYNNKNEEEQEDYNRQEERFIQAVINKYMIDDYGFKIINNEFTQNSYIGIDSDHHNQYNNLSSAEDITYTYLSSKRERGIELPDMISNINGTHNYKLMSAKDIDFDNVILPNSAITSEYNWAGFDPNRRWGNKPIHINNTFELLNVIDYLLCACDNLWNELYKIKYSVNENVQIWFTKDVSSEKLIGINYQLVSQDFQPYSERDNETKMITYLDPTNYYTSLNNKVDNKFGVVTNFTRIDGDINDLYFDRKIMESSGKNIILMVILPHEKAIENHISTISQNIGGILQQIYAYQIGDELKIYPGSRIDAFINSNNIKINPNEIIDFQLKKFKNDTYFKSDSNNNIYSKVYIEFLDSHLGNTNSNYNYNNPYIIYYIDKVSNKKIIISYNHEGSNSSIVMAIKEKLRLKTLNTYEFYDFNNASNDQFSPKPDENSDPLPKFYIIPDEFNSTLEIATPNSKKFAATSKSIKIYYYKKSNKLNCKITRLGKDDEVIEIHPENDPVQSNSMKYHDLRYNIPDNQDITFTFDASYIALNTPDGNPLGLKLDDEYKDIILYNLENINNDESASKYYELKREVDPSNSHKRIFEQFTYEIFNNHKDDYATTDSIGQKYKHTWEKYDNPYQLCLDIDNDELIQQSFPQELVDEEITYIKTHNEFVLSSYNSYTFNHVLTDGLEEIKIDLRFHINETSKVKETECIIPLNINKIYKPTINYYSRKAIELENAYYSDIGDINNPDNDLNHKYNRYTYNNGTKVISLSEIYEKGFRKYTVVNDHFIKSMLDNIPDLVYCIQNEDIETLDELQLPQTYDCTANNAIFEFTYDYNLNSINLLGSWYTEQYLTSKGFGTPNTILKYEDNNPNSIILKSDNTVNHHQSTYHLYLFNFNGFSKNYRLHGNSNTVINNINNDNLTDTQLNPIFNDFDLISIASEKSHQSINEQLKFKLFDDDYQLTYICAENGENWDRNDLNLDNEEDIFHSGFGNIRNNISSYTIKTLPINIYKTTYLVNCKMDYNNVNSPTFTYYVPISYIGINSSTFWPPKETKPNGLVPDINDLEERAKYKQYMDCWNSENHYHPITLSMKLFNNTLKPNPYYYDSNEAKLKMNIKRGQGGGVTIKGYSNTNTWIFVSRNANYYLSDFVMMEPSQDNISNMCPTGSYFYYDETYKDYIPGEIFANTYVSKLGNNHNKHYVAGLTYVKLGNDFTLQFPDYSTSSINKKIPYPIFHKEIENNGTIEYDSTQYDYDIYRLSDINKLEFRESTPIILEKAIVGSTIENNQVTDSSNISPIGGIVNGIDTNTSYYILNIQQDLFINNFINEDSEDPNSTKRFPLIRYQIYYNGVKGSRRYGRLTTTGNIGADTIICPIIRKCQNTFPNIYTGIQYHGDDYEFFEFKYEDIYHIHKENGNYESYSIKPGAQYNNHVLSCHEAYDIQLKLFLNSNADDFISDLNSYTTFINTNTNNP